MVCKVAFVLCVIMTENRLENNDYSLLGTVAASVVNIPETEQDVNWTVNIGQCIQPL